MPFSDFQHAERAATEIPAGLDGLGGHRAFEPDEEDAASDAATAAFAQATLAVPRIPGISLGHHCGPTMALESLGMSGTGPMPFDHANTRLDGVVQCLRRDFDGFLDVAELERVQFGSGAGDQARHAFRGSSHAFWYDDLGDEATLADYRRRIDRFRNLDASATSILFVRVAATTAEVQGACDLLEALKAKVGRHACLLFVLDYQRRVQGPAIVKDCDSLLLYYLRRQGPATSAEEMVAAYAEPIKSALGWLSGAQFQAIPFDTVEHAFQCADEDSSGLCGLGGLTAFKE